MKNKKIKKIILITIASILLSIVLLIAVLFIRQAYISHKINDDYTTVITDEKYHTPVSVDHVEYIKQEISCGYALIEMLSNWQDKNITEQALYKDNNERITTAMGSGFVKEMTKQFPEWEITRYTNLTNSELLIKIYESLDSGMPVPFEFAALYDTGDEQAWTLHFALVTAMDLQNDSITIQNPYGYEETYTIDNFLKATRYDSYEDMEIYLKFGFAFGLFHKNTIYIIENR